MSSVRIVYELDPQEDEILRRVFEHASTWLEEVNPGGDELAKVQALASELFGEEEES